MKSLVRPRAVVAQVLRGGLLCALAKGDIVKYLGDGSGFVSRYLTNEFDNELVTGDGDLIVNKYQEIGDN